MNLPDRFITGSVKPMVSTPGYSAFWKRFDDPVLDQLILRGLVENTSIQQARHRLDIANIQEILAASGYLPQLRLGASANAISDNSTGPRLRGTSVGANGSFSWLVDIFGGGKAARRGALANSQAAADNIEFVRLAYLTDLIITYIEYRYSDAAIAISKRNLGSFSRTLSLTREMREAGTATNLDVAQAQALVDDARAQIPPLEVDRQQAVNHIAALLGVPNTAVAALLKKKKSGQPKMGKLPESGVPADLLRHRPDIRREERLLAAAAARIGVAQSRLYPSLTLDGTIDISRLIVSGFTGSAVALAFGPSVVAPVLDGGRLRAEVDLATAESRVQYLAWKNAVLKAVEEVENAIVAINRGRAENSALSRKVASYQAALNLARESYTGGTGLILDVLEADRSLGAARLDLADSTRRNAINLIRLYIAIGSGAAFDPAVPAQTPQVDRITTASTAAAFPPRPKPKGDGAEAGAATRKADKAKTR